MRLLELKELCLWLGLTPLEILILLFATLIFSFFAALKLDGLLDVTWWRLFTIYFVADGLICYFCVIVFIRQYFLGQYKAAAVRALWSLVQLLALFAFKLLLCFRLDAHKHFTYSEVLAYFSSRCI
ncbi:transmembrane protein 203-like isoform X2 [Varroa jacobsoni]|uniref:transmembrane protein 203-like isoform X2 n=1 Tax=Varroa jacobsoni TaxID=62625 RepID=UPI000BFA7093|nr:transmembrane protein 203-like isoform X2 [Varroa jacobsoni]